MRKRKIRPPKVDMDLTDLNLTAYGGSSILAQTARQYGLFELLDEAVRIKVRNRGATDAETLWAMIASLARGDGALSDLDALRTDAVARTLLGLRNVPEARRAGEWLARLRTVDVKGLWEAARRFAERVAPLIVAHEVETRGHVPVFIDATGIEVDGELFERARKDWEGRRGYWLHAVFLGGLCAAGQLCPGGGRVTLNWRTLLDGRDGAGGDAGLAAGGQRLLQGGAGADLRGARLGLLDQPDQGHVAAAGSGAARRAAGCRLDGHRHGGGGDLRDAPPGRVGRRAALRGGAAAHGERPGSSRSDRAYADSVWLPTAWARAASAISRGTLAHSPHQSRKDDRKPCTVALIPRFLSSLVNVMSDSGLPRRLLENTSPESSRSRRASRTIANARSVNGTRCSRPAFIRDPGIVHMRASASISSIVAPRTSPERAAVRTRNSKASLVAMNAPEARTASTAARTS